MLALVMLVLTPGQIETVPSKDFPKELQVSAVAATVRLKNVTKGTNGSGVIIYRERSFAYILTAHHVVNGATDLEIHTFSADSYPRTAAVYRNAQVLARAEKEDLAVVRVQVGEQVLSILRICPPRKITTEKAFLTLTIGCTDGNAPTCQVEEILGKKVVRKKDQEGTTLCSNALAVASSSAAERVNRHEFRMQPTMKGSLMQSLMYWGGGSAPCWG